MEDGHCVRATHAEMNLIALAAREGISTLGAIIAVTHFPCIHCAKSIIRAGFSGLWYFEDYRDNLAMEVFQKVGISIRQILP
jgi:dCMP deaminase